MKTFHKIEIGATVRSFDFAVGPYGRDLDGPRAAYTEGVVLGIDTSFGDCDRYVIQVSRVVFGGKVRESDPTDRIYPTVNGTCKIGPGDDDVCSGVEILDPVEK